MSDAILGVLKWINDMIMGLAVNGSNGEASSKLTGTMQNWIPSLYSYCEKILTNVSLPIAYTVLALFFVLELYKASVRTEGMGGGPTNLGAEMVFKVLFKLVLCKVAVDSVSIIMRAIYEATTYLTLQISLVNNPGAGNTGMDLDALRPVVEGLDFWTGLVCLIMCFIIFLIVIIAVVLANVVLIARFVEIYVYFAISPIPIATLPNEEMSQIGKGFLKSFAAICIQGSLIFLVLTFFPVLFAAAFEYNYTSGSLAIFSALLGVMGYSIVLILAVFSTGRWAKAICNAM